MINTNLPEIIAHRGASHDAPENTLASIRLGWEQQADGMEVDVHLSRDHQIIVMHDANCLRTTSFDGAISDLTSEQLRQLDAGAWMSAEFIGEPVPTLEEALTILPPEKYFVVEIKSHDHALIPVLEEILVRRAIQPEQLVLIGFDYELMKALKAALPHYRSLLLSGYDGTKSIDELIALCQAANLDGLDLSWNWPIDRPFVQTVRDASVVCLDSR
jgi:glycerophosphoryl diester phosphodiesterase